jgi:hypothetical protein
VGNISTARVESTLKIGFTLGTPTLSQPNARYDPETGRVRHAFSYPLSYDYLPAATEYRRWWGGLYREDHFGTQEVRMLAAVARCAPTRTVMTRCSFFADRMCPALLLQSLDVAVREAVLSCTGTFPTGAVDCITLLRVHGHVFNPITVYLCWDSSTRNRVTHLVSEVTNTPWLEKTVQVSCSMLSRLPSTKAGRPPLRVIEAAYLVSPDALDIFSKLSSRSSSTRPGTSSIIIPQVLDLALAEKGPHGSLVMTKPKTLHVSPFNPTPDGQAQWVGDQGAYESLMTVPE